MLEFLKKLAHSGHGHAHVHRHGHQRSRMRQDTMPSLEAPAAQCPLCDHHCPLIAPGCRKGEDFAMRHATEVKGS
jgi:hypothetical protein